MHEDCYPLWDASGDRIVLDDAGRQTWLTIPEIRKFSSRRQVALDWYRSGRLKRVRLVVAEKEAFPGRCLRRLDPAQPFIVRIHIGEQHYSYMHVYSRCRASYDGRSLYVGSDGQGHACYTRRALSAAHL